MNHYSKTFTRLLSDYDSKNRQQMQALAEQKDSTIRQLQTTIDDLQSKHSELITSLQTKHQDEINALMREINALNSYNKQANDTNKRLQARLDDLTKSENSLKTHWQTLSNEQQTLIDKQNQDIASLIQSNTLQAETIDRLTSSLRQLQATVTSLNNALTGVERSS